MIILGLNVIYYLEFGWAQLETKCAVGSLKKVTKAAKIFSTKNIFDYLDTSGAVAE